MTSDDAQRALFLHWPGFMPQARHIEGEFVVRLVSWPPGRTNERGELQARSPEGFVAALRDLASFTPPLIRCRDSACALCHPA
jgi:hypothetical protein